MPQQPYCSSLLRGNGLTIVEHHSTNPKTPDNPCLAKELDMNGTKTCSNNVRFNLLEKYILPVNADLAKDAGRRHEITAATVRAGRTGKWGQTT